MGSHPRSVFSQYLIQAVQLGVPLVALPVLTRGLGPERFAGYGVLIMWIAVGGMLIDFGLGIWGTKRVSSPGAGADDPDRVFLEVTLTQCALAIALTAPLLWLLHRHGPPGLGLRDHLLVAAAAWLTGINPTWYHTARFAVRDLVPATVASKLSMLLLVVVLLPLWPTVEAALAAYLVGLVWSLWPVWRRRAALGPVFERMRRTDLLGALLGGLPYTLQRMASIAYLNLPPILALAFFGPANAGFYVLAERIVRLLSQGIGPLIAHMLPMDVAAARQAGTPETRARLRRLRTVIMVGAVIATAVLVLASGAVVRLVSGAAFVEAAPVLAVMAPQLALASANAMLQNRLWAVNRERALASWVAVCSAAYLAAVFTVGRDGLLVFAALNTLVVFAELVGMSVLLRSGRRASIAMIARR